MTATKTAASPSSAQAALDAATAATADAYDAISPAGDDLAAARAALEAAEADLLTSVVVKSPDPKAAKARIDSARAALKTCEAEVEWCVLKLHAAEIQYQDANEAEQQARHAVFVEEYQAEQVAFNDPRSRETTLLRRVADDVAELTILLSDRKDLHDNLSSHWASLPADQRPAVKGRPIQSTPTRVIPAGLNGVAPEVLESIKSGLARAEAEQAERRRVAQFG